MRESTNPNPLNKATPKKSLELFVGSLLSFIGISPYLKAEPN
jgi:hypothetical protein